MGTLGETSYGSTTSTVTDFLNHFFGIIIRRASARVMPRIKVNALKTRIAVSETPTKSLTPQL